MPLDYDALAREYAAHRQVHPEVLRRLLLDGGIGPRSRVLEVGCGTGTYASAICEVTGCRCWGVDPSTAMLGTAAARCPGTRLQLARAEALPLASGAFDLVFSVDVIHHLADPRRYLAEAHRVLAGGGKVCTVTDSEQIIRTRRPLAEYFPETIEVELRRYPRLEDLQAIMRRSGFEELREVTVEYVGLLTDIGTFRDKAYSSLHLIPPEAFRRGLARMASDLEAGGIPWISRYVMLWGKRRSRWLGSPPSPAAARTSPA